MTAEDTRKLLECEPQLLKLMDALKSRFDAKLCWLKAANVEIGKSPARLTPPGHRWEGA